MIVRAQSVVKGRSFGSEAANPIPNYEGSGFPRAAIAVIQRNAQAASNKDPVSRSTSTGLTRRVAPSHLSGRACFAAMVLVLVIPLDLITVRTRPASAGTLRSVAEAGRALPGLELARAFRIGALYTRADLSRLRNQCQHFTRARSHPAAGDRFFAGASRKNLGHPAGFDYFGTPAYGLFG